MSLIDKFCSASVYMSFLWLFIVGFIVFILVFITFYVTRFLTDKLEILLHKCLDQMGY